ncbi:hypothetical protein C8R43DRAFT_1129493 [Mycena crocata]|nr:hypothetical protein C8R43DRAFT_1129493 [Mycena crocata]
MDAPEKPTTTGRVTRSRAAKDKGAVVEPAPASPPKRGPRKKKQGPATDKDKKVVTKRKTKASADIQTAPEDKMQLDATAVAEDKMQLDERREEEQERVEQPTEDPQAQREERELNQVALVALAQGDMQSVSREREISLAPQLSALKGLLHASPAEAQLHAQFYPAVSPVPIAAQQASSAPTWGTMPLAGPGLSRAVPVPVGVGQAVAGSADVGRGVPELGRLPRVDFKTLLPRVDFRRLPADRTQARMNSPEAQATEQTPSPSPTRSGNAPSVNGTPAASSPLPRSSPPHRAASSPARDDQEDEQDHQQDLDDGEHDDEQEQEQGQEVDEQEQDVDMEEEDLIDSGAEDDYAATIDAEDRQLKKARATVSWLPIETTQEEDDEEDNREFEAEFEAAEFEAEVGTQRGGNRNRPNKRKAVDSVEDDDGAQGGPSQPTRRLKKAKKNTKGAGEEEEEEEEEHQEGGRYKAGPIDKMSAETLYRWKQELEEKVEELAKDIRKPASSLWALILPTHRGTRAKTGYNMWQAWLYTPKEAGGGGQRPDPSLSKAEQAQQDRDKLCELLPATVRDVATKSETIFEHLPWLVEWDKNTQAELLADRQNHGAMSRGIGAYAKELTKLCEAGHKELDLHIMGSIISTDGGSRAFGSTEAVQLYKQRHQQDERRKLKDLEAQLRVLELEISGATAAEILQAQQLMWFPSQEYAEASVRRRRDGERTWLKDRLLDDICSIEVARNNIKPEEVATTRLKMSMKWATWADYAYEKKLRLENWDDTMAAGGHIPKNGFRLTWFDTSDLARIMPALEARYGLPDAEEGLGDDSIKVVSWTEREIRYTLEKQQDIPVVTTVDGTIALRVSNSHKYVLAAGKEQTGRNRAAAKAGKSNKGGRGTTAPSASPSPSPSPSPSSPAFRHRSPSPTRERASRRRSASPVRGPARPGRSGRRESPSHERRRDRSPPPRRRSRTGSPTPRPARRRSPDAAPARHGARSPPSRSAFTEKRRLLEITKLYLLEGEEEGASKLTLSKFCFIRGSSNAREFSPQFYGRLREDDAGTRVPRETFCRVRSADYPDGGWKRMGKDCTIQFLSVEQLQIFKKYRERWDLSM